MRSLREKSLKTPSKRTANRPERLRRSIAAGCFVVGLLLSGWLLLAMLDMVPLALPLPGESPVRSHAGATVLFFMIAAWGYWEN